MRVTHAEVGQGIVAVITILMVYYMLWFKIEVLGYDSPGETSTLAPWPITRIL